MPVVARSLVNYPQTISGQTIPPHGQRTYGGPTSALTTAQTNGLVKLASYDDPSGPNTPAGAAQVGSVYYNAPLTGETYDCPDDAEQVLIKPAGTIAAHTFNMPVNPYDGQLLRVAMTQTITALTMAATGKTLNGGLTAGAANGFAAWRYRAADTTWYRVG